jgi:arginine/lysine/ornithine decarboxylase
MALATQPYGRSYNVDVFYPDGMTDDAIMLRRNICSAMNRHKASRDKNITTLVVTVPNYHGPVMNLVRIKEQLHADDIIAYEQNGSVWWQLVWKI